VSGVGVGSRSGRVGKIASPPGVEPWTVQPIASRYTDWAMQNTTVLVFISVSIYSNISLLHCSTEVLQYYLYNGKASHTVYIPDALQHFIVCICTHTHTHTNTNTQYFVYFFEVRVTVYHAKFLITKPIRCINFSNLFLEWNSVCFGQFLCPSTVVFHCACEQSQDGTPVLSWSCSQAVSKPVWNIPLLCVQWKTPDDGQGNCAKHVEFYSKNNFEKLVHLVGFIIRNAVYCPTVPAGLPRWHAALLLLSLSLIPSAVKLLLG
jgi:hypothetical protein